MNIKIIAFVACRLLTLYVAVNYGLAALYALAGSLIDAAWRGVGAGAVLLVIAFGVSLVLWHCAARISAWLTRGLPENGGSASWTAADWQTMAVVCVGGLFALTGLHFLGALLQMHMTHDAEPRTSTLLLFHVLLYIVVGCILMASARSLVSGLRNLRKWGTEPYVHEDEP